MALQSVTLPKVPAKGTSVNPPGCGSLQSGTTIAIPLDWYKALQVSRGTGSLNVMKAYDRLLNDGPEDVYTEVSNQLCLCLMFEHTPHIQSKVLYINWLGA